MMQNTKKFGCPSQIILKEIVQFPDFQNTQWRRKEASKNLKVALEKNAEIVKVTKFVIVIPDKDSHQNHVMGTTNWQHRLLKRYGDKLVLLYATYHTARYALPLFFLVVKTNVDYQVVAAFVCESESTESCTTVICDFHREQAWERWLRKTSNGCAKVRKEILVFKKFPLWSWDLLSPLYINSVFLTLDEAVIQHRQNETEEQRKHNVATIDKTMRNITTDIPGADTSSATDENNDNQTLFSDVPQNQVCTSTVAAFCRENLDEIKSLTFLLQDNEIAINEALHKLKEVKGKL
eukprot:gene12566-13853_t